MGDSFEIPSDLDRGGAEPASPPSEPITAPEAPAPLVIVEYRYRGVPSWLVLVLLVALTGAGTVFFRRHATRLIRTPAPRSNPPTPVAFADTAPGWPGEPAASATVEMVEPPTVLNGQGTVLLPLPEPATAATTQPELPDTAPPERTATAGAIPGVSHPVPSLAEPRAEPRAAAGPREPAREDDPAPEPAAPGPPERPATGSDRAPAESTGPNSEPPLGPAEPPPPPTPTPEEVERAIQREADAKQADLDLMREAKGEARRLDQIEDARRAYDDRVEFHRQLREILRAGGPTAGRRIDELCDQFGRDFAPEHRTAVKRRIRTRLPERSTRHDYIAFLRAHDVPEPVILDDVSRQIDRHLMNARGGVRSPDEVRVRAARELLAVPLKPRSRTRDAQPAGTSADR